MNTNDYLLTRWWDSKMKELGWKEILMVSPFLKKYRYKANKLEISLTDTFFGVFFCLSVGEKKIKVIWKLGESLDKHTPELIQVLKAVVDPSQAPLCVNYSWAESVIEELLR
jgi:hypothetical protein